MGRRLLWLFQALLLLLKPSASALSPAERTNKPPSSLSSCASFDLHCLQPLSAVLGTSPGSSPEEACQILLWNISSSLLAQQQAACLELAATVISLPEGVAEELYGEGGCDGLQTTAAVERLKNYVS